MSRTWGQIALEVTKFAEAQGVRALRLAGVVCLLAAGAWGGTVVQETAILAPGGGLASGVIAITPSAAFVAASGVRVEVVTREFPVVNGTFRVELEPNDTGVPAGTSYLAIWKLRDGRYRREVWQVPTSVAPVRISDVAMPQPVAPFAVDGNLAVFDGESGRVLRDAGVSPKQFASVAAGVTGGDTHDHEGGDGAAVPYASLAGIPATFAPSAHAATHAEGAADEVTAAAIGAAASTHNHDLVYAAIAAGVTGGNTHDHAGGDGAQIAYGSLSGVPGTFAPSAHAASHAAGQADEVTPAAIGAAASGHDHASITGTAAALGADGTNCPGGQAAGGVDAAGNAQGCFAPSGTGDVTGPAASVDGEVALFDGVSGKVLKRASASGVAKLTSGVLGVVSGSATDCVKVDGSSGACATGAALGDFAPSVNGNVLTVAAGKASISSQFYSIAQGTVTFGGTGGGDCKVFVDDQGIPTTYCVNDPDLTIVPGGAMVAVKVTTPAVPAGAIAVADLTVTAGVPAIDADMRAFFNGASVRAGVGVLVTTASGVQEVGIDPATIPQLGAANDFTGANDFSAGTIRIRTGSGLPPGTGCNEAGEVGHLYARSDAAAAAATLYVCSNTAAATWAWELAQGGGTGSGDVTGPAASVDGEVALFDGVSGKVLKRASASGVAKLTSGVLGVVSGSATDCVKVDGSSGACATGAGYDVFDRSVAQFSEEFASTGLSTTGNIGSLGWKLENNNGTASVSQAAGEANHPGIVRVKTATTSANDSTIAMRNGSSTADLVRLDNITGWEFQFIVRPTQDATVGYWVGLGGSGMASAANAIRIKWDTNDADATWVFQACDGTCSSANSTVSLVAGTWYRIRIRSTVAGTILYSVNGEAEGSLNTHVPTALLSPAVTVKTRTNAESSMDVDWFAGKITVSR